MLVSAPYMLPALDQYRLVLEEHGVEVVTVPVRERLTEPELLPLVGDLDGVICGDDEFTERVLEAAPGLKVISKWGTGVDSIDRKAAERLGILVCNTPGAFTDPVADTVMGYVLVFARQVLAMDREMRQGRWQKRQSASLRECVLGVVGVGNVGKAVVRRAVAFGMRVLGNDIVEIPQSFVTATGLEVVGLDQLLSLSDFVSLNCDLNPTSYHLIGDRELNRMKPTAHLINTSRGRVVDEAALVRALQARRIAGAALDVFEVEPLPAGSPLRALDDCLLAPHNANSSSEAARRVHENTIRNLLQGLGVLTPSRSR
ncbi:MAG: phosphoglycerate dehydrogenase [Gemmatimonadota bacterium]